MHIIPHSAPLSAYDLVNINGYCHHSERLDFVMDKGTMEASLTRCTSTTNKAVLQLLEFARNHITRDVVCKMEQSGVENANQASRPRLEPLLRAIITRGHGVGWFETLFIVYAPGVPEHPPRCLSVSGRLLLQANLLGGVDNTIARVVLQPGADRCLNKLCKLHAAAIHNLIWVEQRLFIPQTAAGEC